MAHFLTAIAVATLLAASAAAQQAAPEQARTPPATAAGPSAADAAFDDAGGDGGSDAGAASSSDAGLRPAASWRPDAGVDASSDLPADAGRLRAPDAGAPSAPPAPREPGEDAAPEVVSAGDEAGEAGADDEAATSGEPQPAGDEAGASPGGDPEAPDDPSLAKELDEAARELEELHAAEDSAVDGEARLAEQVLRALVRGAGGPSHQRIEDALDARWGLPIAPSQAEIDAAALAEVGAFDLERVKRSYDIPVEMQPLVAEYIRFFQTAGRKHFVRWLSRSTRYIPMMRKALREAGLPEDTVYLSMIESGFSTLAYSRARASGLWQFIEPTGRRFGLHVDFWVDDRRDPIRSTVAAAGYLKELYHEFGDWRLAWAGYNAGAGKVRRAIKADASSNFWDMVHGRTLRKETKHYVPKLMAAALVAKNLKAFGFSESEFAPLPPLQYDEAEVPEATDLEVIARSAEVSVDEIKELNPQLRRWCTPPGRSPDERYRIRLPAGTRHRFVENFAKVAPKDRLSFRVHRVGRGDTLSQIALKYGSAPEAIMRTNGIRDSRKLRLGAELVVPVPRGSSSSTQLAAQARRSGFRAAPAEQEIPATAASSRGGAAAGSVRVVQEGGRRKVLYGVASGDSLWSIARNFDVTVEQLKEWNGLHGRRPVLRIGQEVVLYPPPSVQVASTGHASPPPAAAAVPASSTKVAAARTAADARPDSASNGATVATAPRAATASGRLVHVIAPGETLWSLARRYGVSVDDIKRWNNIRRTQSLQIGQSLTVRP